MDKLNPKIIRRKAAKDGLGNNVRDYIFNPAENKFEHKDDLVHVSSYDMKPKEPKIGSVEHKHKFPDRYKAGYVDWWNRDKKEKINNEPLVKQFRNEQYTKDTTSISADEIKYLKPKSSEIKKAPTYFPTNERMPETPPPNFEKPVDLDLFKGLGSFLGTARKDYQK